MQSIYVQSDACIAEFYEPRPSLDEANLNKFDYVLQEVWNRTKGWT